MKNGFIKKVLAAALAATMFLSPVSSGFVMASESAGEAETVAEETIREDEEEQQVSDREPEDTAADTEGTGTAAEDVPEDALPQESMEPDGTGQNDAADSELANDGTDSHAAEDIPSENGGPEDDAEDAGLPDGYGEQEDFEEDTGLPANILECSNEDSEEVKRGKSGLYRAVFTSENDFPEGASASIAQVSDEETIKEYEAVLNKEYDAFVNSVILPFELGVFDQDGEKTHTAGDIDVRIYMDDTSDIDGSVLYHLRDDGTWEELDYEALPASEEEQESIRFVTESFSPFIFAQRTEAETEEQQDGPVPEDKEKEDTAENKGASEKAAAETDRQDTARKAVAGAAKAPSRGVTVPIAFLLKNLDGTDVSDADIGSGFDLVVYEFPASLYNVDVNSADENTVSFIKNSVFYDNGSLYDYRETVRIRSRSTDMALNMENDASEENPYIFCVLGSDGADGREWVSGAIVWYDGTQVHEFPGENQNVDYDSQSGRYGFTIRHDDTLFSPKVTFLFESDGGDADRYPVTVTVDGVQTTVTQDGEYAITLPKKVSRHFLEEKRQKPYPENTAPLSIVSYSVTFPDTESSTWTLSTNDALHSMSQYLGNTLYICDVDADDNIRGLDTTGGAISIANRLIIKAKNGQAGFAPRAKVRLAVGDGLFEEEELPLYLKITAVDSRNSQWTDTKVIPFTAEDMNKDVTVTFDHADPYLEEGSADNVMDFYFTVCKDEECTEADTGWGYYYDGYSGQWTWLYDDDADGIWTTWRNWVDDQGQWHSERGGPMEIFYRMAKLSIPYAAFTNNADSFYPAYLKVSAFGQDRVVELTGNTSGTIDMGKINTDDIYGSSVEWTVYADEACTQVHEGWNIENRSMQVGWNTNALVEYYNYDHVFSIDLSNIQTQELAVPMETDVGEFDPALFFPSYMTAVLHSPNGGFEDVVVKKVLSSPQDANGSIVFTAGDGDVFDSGDEYELYAVITAEEIEVSSRQDLFNSSYLFAFSNEADMNWAQAVGTYYSGSGITASLQGDGKLHQGIGELKLVYRPVSVEIMPDLYKVTPDDDTHVYVKTWLIDQPVPAYGGPTPIAAGNVYDFREIRDGSRFTSSFPMLGYAGAHLSVTSAMTENPDQRVTTLYNCNEIRTSEDTYFYADSKEGSVAADGTMKQQDTRMVLKPYESVRAFKSLNVPVKIHMPEEGQPYFDGSTAAGGSSPYEWAYYDLWRVDPETGNRVSFSADNYYGRSYTAVRVSALEDLEGSINRQLRAAILPGTYYIDYGLSGTYGSTSYADMQNMDIHWTHEKGIKVILTQDGQLTWEDGTPVELHYYYSSVLPQWDVHAEYPDGSEEYGGHAYDASLPRLSYDEYTPSSLWYSIESVDTQQLRGSGRVYLRTGYSTGGEQVANVPEGDSMIGTPDQRYRYLKDLYYTYVYPQGRPEGYSYDGGTVIAAKYERLRSSGYYPSAYIGSESQYDYPDSIVVGYPEGDYYLTYYMTGDSTARTHWYSEDRLKVHLAQDGKFYVVNDDGTCDTEPYVIQIRYLGEDEPENAYDALRIQVNTTVPDGVPAEKAFTNGETFVAMVTEFRNRDSAQRTDYVAVGTAQITEAGTMQLELTAPDGGKIQLHDDACYNLSYGTMRNWTGTFSGSAPDLVWPYYNNTADSYTYTYSSHENHPDTAYPVYFTAANVDSDGTIKGFIYQEDPPGTSYYSYEHYVGRTSDKGDTGGEPLIFNNDCLIKPWSETAPGTVAQSSQDKAIIYRPISDITSIREGGNYIIVVQNRYDNKWYAMFTDENGGDSVELTGITSLDDLEAGFKVDNSAVYKKMVFTASKLTPGSDSVSLQLKSGTTDNAGKFISLKMGQSSDDPQPLLSGSAGTVIIRSTGDKQFSVTKGNYSWLWYIDNLYGWSGFTTVSNKFGPKYAGRYGNDYLLYGLLNSNRTFRSDYNRWVTTGGNPYGNNPVRAVYAGIANHGMSNRYMADVKDKYLNSAYLNRLESINSAYPGAGYNRFYILSDDIEEAQPEQPVTKYTLVKTFGDFVQTYAGSGGKQSSNMLLVYTDADGKEYAMEAGGLKPVVTKAGSSDYRTVTTVADRVLIPNNNSGTSADFSIDSAEVKEDGTYVFATSYAFRKSRQNSTENRNYLTMNGGTGVNAWTKNDDSTHDGNLVYVLHPTNPVMSQADWGTAQEYRLSVVRNGETVWLGIGETDDGEGNTVLQMTAVASESDAVTFRVYTDRLTRYYASAYGTDLYKYNRITNLTDINAGDEILIVYNDNGTKKIMGLPFADSGQHVSSLDGNYYSAYQISPAVEVLTSYSVLDTREPDAVDAESRYRYRLGTDEYIKKPFAYIDSEDDSVIWAQGVAANAIGTAKTEKPNQRKYADVSPLGNTGRYIYIKAGVPDAYGAKAAETNFFAGSNEGEFFIRGGKSDAWLGETRYKRTLLSLETGAYEYVGNYLSFTTTGTDSRIPVEIYRRPTTNETFQVQYYTERNVLERTETKPQESFTLTQKQDIKKDGNTYVFVGYTTEYEKSGFLSLDDSANLYDYDDVANVASIKQDVRTQYGLLGDCNPEEGNLIGYDEVSEKVVTETVSGQEVKTLKVYPVYALRGYSAAVTADDNSRMIIGASDQKDLQSGHSGATNPKERWLGSINIEVYKDGELWVPGAGGSTTGLRKGPAPAQKATLYFAYHNDNAADLNIKFIEDSITADTLYDYMSNDDFSATEPSERYIIDAVWAEQGGSEDGLKYYLNWMDAEHGGQLDNVKGGSTVRIYVTTKYQVKYYLDNDGTGYKELTGDAWQDEGYYTTPGTENAVNALGRDYLVRNDNEYSRLIEYDPTDGSTFKDEAILRGEYSEFLYTFDSYDHSFDAAPLPGADIVGAGVALRKPVWSVRDADLAETQTVDPESEYTLTGTSYGTGNTVYSFTGTKAPFAGDKVNTFHLTLDVIADVAVEKYVESEAEADLQTEFTFTMTLTDNVHTEEADKVMVSGTYGDLEFVNNVATFTLKHGQQKTAKCLPAGMTYTVAEGPVDGFQVKSSRNETGTVQAGEVCSVRFVNEPKRAHDLTVTKTVSGSFGSRVKLFDFTASFTGRGIPETIPYVVREDGEDDVTGTLPVASGTVSFRLRHGQTITLSGIPDGTAYRVEETRADKDGYQTSAIAALGTVAENDSVSGTLTDNEVVVYTNNSSGIIPTGLEKTFPRGIFIAICAVAAAAYVIKKKKEKG